MEDMITDPSYAFFITGCNGIEQWSPFLRGLGSENGRPEIVLLSQKGAGTGGEPGFLRIARGGHKLQNETQIIEMLPFLFAL
jgi:hypothetical protein